MWILDLSDYGLTLRFFPGSSEMVSRRLTHASVDGASTTENLEAVTAESRPFYQSLFLNARTVERRLLRKPALATFFENARLQRNCTKCSHSHHRNDSACIPAKALPLRTGGRCYRLKSSVAIFTAFLILIVLCHQFLR